MMMRMMMMTYFGLAKPLTHGREGPNPGGQNPGFGFWTRKTTHPREEGPNPWVKSRLRILDSEDHSPTGAKSVGQNPSYGYGSWKTSHPPCSKISVPMPRIAIHSIVILKPSTKFLPAPSLPQICHVIRIRNTYNVKIFSFQKKGR